MRGKNVFAIIFICVFIILLIFAIANTQSKCVLEGKYVIFPGVNPKMIQLTYTLFDKSKKSVNDYTFRLKKDGSFRIAIKDRGEFYLMQTGESYPTTNPFDRIVYSNEMRPYFYKFEKDSVIKLDDIYVSKLIEIELPKENENYGDPNELTFRWTSVPFADCYSLTVVKLSNSGDEEIILSSHKIDSNDVSYKAIKDNKIITGEISYDDLKNSPMFNRVNKPLNKGKYKLLVQAYKHYDEKKDVWLLSHTDYNKRHYFYIDGD